MNEGELSPYLPGKDVPCVYEARGHLGLQRDLEEPVSRTAPDPELLPKPWGRLGDTWGTMFSVERAPRYLVLKALVLEFEGPGKEADF